MSANDRRMVHSTKLRGATERETGKPHLYRGFFYRIPGGDELKQLSVEAEMSRKLENALRDDGELEFPADGIIERYEANDVETGDLLVMIRVPFRQKEGAHKGASAGAADSKTSSRT